MFRHADHCLHNHPHNASNRQFRQFYISYLPLYFRPQLSQRFIPIYLYTLGYDVAAIGLFYVSTTPSGYLPLSRRPGWSLERFKSLMFRAVPAGRQRGFLQSS